MKRIYVVGTADTKGEELAFLAERIRALGADPLLVDVGIRSPTIPPEVGAAEVAKFGPPGLLEASDRGTAVAGMADAFAQFVITRDDIAGMVGIGGGGGTSIITAGMRKLPISDIVMMPSVTDLAGLNRISRVILSNAALAVVAMSANPTMVEPATKLAVGLTMFGVTTPAVTQIVEMLTGAVEPLVFHATGTGGKTMEMLVDSGLVRALIDVTTTEVCDYLLGGVLPAGPERLDCISRRPVPYVGSVGACDMVNFWAPETVPPHYANRLLHAHNANVTLMRTTGDECRAIGEWIGGKLNAAIGPLRGVSALDIEGGVFRDAEADAELFDAIERTVQWRGERQLIRLDCHINDPSFAEAAVRAFHEITS